MRYCTKSIFRTTSIAVKLFAGFVCSSHFSFYGHENATDTNGNVLSRKLSNLSCLIINLKDKVYK